MPKESSKPVKKRTKKDSSKQNKVSKAKGSKNKSKNSPIKISVGRSVTSTPKRLESISEVSKSGLEYTSDKNISIISDIEESEKERIEKEVQLSKTDSPESNSDYLNKSLNTRSMTKELMFKRHINDAKRTPKIIKFERVLDDSDEERNHIGRTRKYYNAIYTPIKNRIMTPMKRITSNSYNKVANSYIFKSETITTIFLVVMVGISLLLGSYNHISKGAKINYEFEDNVSVPYMMREATDSKRFICTEGSIIVGHL